MNAPNCRFCGTPLENIFVDLGMSPLSNAYLPSDKLLDMEPFYPLKVFVCHDCFLVQLPAFNSSEEIFSDYAYFSSYSDSWLDHCKHYVQDISKKYALDTDSLVIEVASNDGYLLQFFKPLGISVLGIEPAENVAKVAVNSGIETIVEFFGRELATSLRGKNVHADLLIGNNVLAHVPDLNDFVAGLAILLSSNGVVTMEFPHLMRLMEDNQYDTIYHEHFSYFSFMTVQRVFQSHGLKIFDVDRLHTHGGSLRIHACRATCHKYNPSDNCDALLRSEVEYGLDTLESYRAFADRVHASKRQLLEFLIACRERGETVVGYGAPAKGNTLLNYCGVREDLLSYTVDRSPHKHGRYLPGTHIPICKVDKIIETQPDYLLILPWNLKEEIMDQMAGIDQWGGKFVIPIPEVKIYSDMFRNQSAGQE